LQYGSAAAILCRPWRDEVSVAHGEAIDGRWHSMKRASIYGGSHREESDLGSDRDRGIDPGRSAAAQPAPSPERRSGLGPRGQALFERLFGGSRSPAPAALERREAPVIALASGKGGTGKSFLATSLAVVLFRMGYRTTLVDCDFGLACDHLLLGVKPGTHLQHVLQGRLRVDEVRIATPHGPSLLPGVTGVRQMAQLQDHEMRAFGEALGGIAAGDDVVLLDTGAGLSPQTVLTLCAADHVVLVTQPEIAALTDAYAVIKTLAQVRSAPEMSIVVNRVYEAGHGEATFEKLCEVAGRHVGVDLHFLGSIHDDPLVTQRRLGQPPLVVSDPDNPTARAVEEVARNLLRIAGPFEPRLRGRHQDVAERLAAHQRLV
jgi:flagellar biosynthesis protein FlhG